MRTMTSIFFFAIALFLSVAVLRTFVVDSFFVGGMSMAPALQPGDYVFVNKLAYVGESREPARGDVVVAEFRAPDVKVIKRVVGLPREWVHHASSSIQIAHSRSEEAVTVHELKNPNPRATSTHRYRLDPHEYYLVGDNELLSADSKEYGPTDRYRIRGKVILHIRFDPLTVQTL